MLFVSLCVCSPSTASPFCLSSAVSLSVFFNNGAMPCACHEVGAESDTCEQFGGQCKCRPNVIGRECSMCATGYWGFPNCKRKFSTGSFCCNCSASCSLQFICTIHNNHITKKKQVPKYRFNPDLNLITFSSMPIELILILLEGNIIHILKLI